MNTVHRYIPTALQATETFLTELNPYIPLLSCLTGVLMTADGVSRMMTYGISKAALAKTAIGVGMTALSSYSLNKIAARPAIEAQKLWCETAVAKATKTTQLVLDNSLIGLNTTKDLLVSCNLNENSKSFLDVIYHGSKNIDQHTMYNDCVVTISQANIVDKKLWLEQTTQDAKICVPISEGTVYRAHHFGATISLISHLIADFSFKILR